MTWAAAKTSIGIFVEGSLSYSCVLPVGAKNITNDLAIGLRVSLETAEKIKIALSDHSRLPEGEITDELDVKKLNLNEEVGKLSRKTLIEGIIRPRLNEIFSLIGEQLKQSGFGGATPAGIVITGGWRFNCRFNQRLQTDVILAGKSRLPQRFKWIS